MMAAVIALLLIGPPTWQPVRTLQRGDGAGALRVTYATTSREPMRLHAIVERCAVVGRIAGARGTTRPVYGWRPWRGTVEVRYGALFPPATTPPRTRLELRPERVATELMTDRRGRAEWYQDLGRWPAGDQVWRPPLPAGMQTGWRFVRAAWGEAVLTSGW